MTRKQILNLEPGPELNQLVAEEVMRWSKSAQVVSTGFVFQPVEFWEEAGKAIRPVKKWSPSTDIAAAWEVVQRLISEGIFVDIESTVAGEFRVRLWSSDPIDLLAEVYAPTAPLAISRAALLAMEGGR